MILLIEHHYDLPFRLYIIELNVGSVGSAELGPPRRPSQVEVPRWKLNFSSDMPNPGEKQQNTVRIYDVLTIWLVYWSHHNLRVQHSFIVLTGTIHLQPVRYFCQVKCNIVSQGKHLTPDGEAEGGWKFSQGSRETINTYILLTKYTPNFPPK